MSDRILDRFAATRVDGIGSSDASADAEALDNLGAFGFLRGARERAVMVELRLKDGRIRAIPYAWIEDASFDPSDGIALQVNGRQITIKGRNLNVECRPEVRLFSALCRHKVAWIQEADEPTVMETEEKATLIERIEW